MTISAPRDGQLSADDATTYAEWFARLGEPMRVRLLHAVAAAGSTSVGALAERLEISESTCSHHVRKLAEVGFVLLHEEGTATRVSVNQACRTGLPHAADAVLGLLPLSCCPRDVPADVPVRAMTDDDLPAVRRIYAEGIATGDATFETEVPDEDALRAQWLSGHRWVAEVAGAVAGWAAAAPVSARECYAGVAETSVYVGDGVRGRGVGKALLHRQVTAADEGGLWTLQNSIFPENRASLALHRSAGFHTVGLRERVARHHGRWRDTVVLERRRAED
ncbi:helix-turn-helix domain-containing GNAT family N-acetyltransferase [Saccharopolyspora cebuensis]|uniref:Helix-turn-helix domain-containing GNAT family N-acetyltransferase n=1 Tax=Saccharopolyspora cebuensis TaxID=418759 RepID=A0ABV4CFL9_9PSEU